MKDLMWYGSKSGFNSLNSREPNPVFKQGNEIISREIICGSKKNLWIRGENVCHATARMFKEAATGKH